MNVHKCGQWLRSGQHERQLAVGMNLIVLQVITIHVKQLPELGPIVDLEAHFHSDAPGRRIYGPEEEDIGKFVSQYSSLPRLEATYRSAARQGLSRALPCLQATIPLQRP
jgi:hypothetical protein